MENTKVDTLEDFYLTYTTIMVRLIDTYTLARMMKRVINDIDNNEGSIIERIQEIDFDTRMSMGQGLFDWIKNEKYFLDYRDANLFLNKFEEAFSEEVREECEFKYEVRKFSYGVNRRKDNISITLYKRDFLPKINNVISKALLKFDEKNEILKLSYIETPFRVDSKYEVELFYYMNKVYKKLKKQNKKLKFSFNKKYQPIFEEAVDREYLKGGIYENQTK